MVLQRQQIVNDENGNRLDKAIPLDDIRVDLTPDFLAKDVTLINVLTGEPLNINGQMNMADAQNLLFNLIASFRVFLAIQAQTAQIIEGN